MDILIYDNYPKPNCPFHLHVYSTSVIDGAGISEPFYIIVPDSFKTHYENGKLFLNLPESDREYTMDEVLSNRNGMPAIEWIGRRGEHHSFIPGTFGVPWA